MNGLYGVMDQFGVKRTMTGRRVLFVSVHPDDETLGCGGTMLRFKAEGAQVFWLNITDGSLDHPFGFTKERLEKREATVNKVVTAYNVDGYDSLRFPTQMLETVEPRILIGSIKSVYDKYYPDTLFVTNRSDIHSDHRVAFDALYSAAKSFRAPYIKQVYMYETLSETEFAPALPEKAFIPNSFVDISEYMDEKLKIMQLYHTELMPDPYPRSIHAIKGLGALRGSRIGVMYAEAFQLLFQAV